MNEKITIETNGINSINDLFYIGMSRNVPDLIMSNGTGVEINLGSGNNKTIHGAIDIDYPEWDAEYQILPYDNNSVDVIHCYHFLEHIKNVTHVMKEIDRVLKVGGHANIVVPYYSSEIAFGNLDHRTFFTEKSFPRLFNETSYDNTGGYKFNLKVHFQFIIGIVERNMCLMLQVVKL